MSLGVGGATPFAMKSNHQTAYNHSFRDCSGYDPSRQTKIKCSFCGCWAKKGSVCYQCKRPVGTGTARVAPQAAPPPPKVTTPRSGTPATLSGSQSRPSSSLPRASSSMRVPDNALQHTFRETSSYDPSSKLRVKCCYCGCWATRGTNCYFCKTFNK